jgi:predicted small secreted protein
MNENRVALFVSGIALSIGIVFGGLYLIDMKNKSAEPPAEPLVESVEPPKLPEFRISLNTGSWMTSKTYYADRVTEAKSGDGRPFWAFIDKNTGNMVNIYQSTGHTVTLELMKEQQ